MTQTRPRHPPARGWMPLAPGASSLSVEDKEIASEGQYFLLYLL